jgi:soluble lytic murein transglycosylase-like protein
MISRDDNKTKVALGASRHSGVIPVRALYPGPGGNPATRRFRDRFVIGRAKECEICLSSDGVSRRHCEIFHDGADWWVRDLDSSNGTFVDGRQTAQARLGKDTRVEFFDGGPVVRLQIDDTQISGLAPHTYPPEEDPQGVSTMAGSARAHTTPRHLLASIVMLVLLLLSAIVVIVMQYRQQGNDEEIARSLFEETKALELELARLRRELAPSPDQPLPPAIAQADERLRAMKTQYVNLARERELIGSYRSKQDLLIFRIARIFGEYDLAIPDSFVAEVKRYIREWQQSDRLANAVARINQDNHGLFVAQALRRRGLPPQFIYLAVQESNFRSDAIGPRTRYGIAKGMWQFIPSTAERYGLRTGPDKGKRRFDPHDDRFNFERATQAAADYLSFLFTTEAQASGLLVMSAYNWGEGNVARTLGRFSNDPGQYNFWRLIQSQMIPDETYSYVLRIYAAAVIGEDPSLFGFDFENPLAGL